MNRVPSKQRSDQAASTGGNATDLLGDPATPGVLVPLALLGGVEQRGTARWVALCPVHKDRRRPNLCIDVRRNAFGVVVSYFCCKTCGANGDAVLAELGLAAHAQAIYHRGNDTLLQRRPKYVAPLPSLDELDEWRAALQADEERWHFVTKVRGVAPKIAHQFRLGWDAARRRYTFPVAGEDGQLANVRLYSPDAEPGEGKMTNTTGHGAARLYPALPPSGARTVYVTEGEWDALAARSQGLTAISGTAGAGTWLPEWSVAVAGRHAAFLYDCDLGGREGAAKAAASVEPFATSVRVVDLGLPEHGDVSDWFASGRTVDELRALINATPIAGGA